MGRRELVGRFRCARDKGRGVTLSPGEVTEVIGHMEAMSRLILKLNSAAINVFVPFDLICESIPCVIGLSDTYTCVELAYDSGRYVIIGNLGDCEVSDNSFTAAIIKLRRKLGLSEMDQCEITIPGSLIYDCLMAEKLGS